jgi:hypothetical protein
MKEIEPKIKPLVDALNATGILETFSSCEGHFNEYSEYNDKKKADVRFDTGENATEGQIEKFITFLITEFEEKHSFVPAHLSAYKLFAPNRDATLEPDFVYVIEIKPFKRSDSASEKRGYIDKAILQLTDIVNEYSN